MIIHIQWDGPYTLDKAKAFKDEDIDYGVYSLSGYHPVYGNDTLLYIGKANAQTLGVRISQHQWEYRDNPNLLRIYIGRLVGRNSNISSSDWENQINLAEKLLIYSHKPSDNSISVGNIPETELMNLHIYNWNNYGKLLPEVSGGRYTTKYDYWDYDSFYNMKNCKD